MNINMLSVGFLTIESLFSPSSPFGVLPGLLQGLVFSVTDGFIGTEASEEHSNE